ncbi:hypothetical protein BC941DRAFT_224696 [Chlamydoabsidia padenii]|nr:hypothetical protein BC941DRAFT_224696 [Chlamydoabsidia padenii]
MSTVQGLHTRVNLKNGDIFYGYATQVDDDGSISLEKAKRCFMSGRVSEYAFMKVPGHSVLDYYPTVEEQPSSTVTGIATQTTQSAQHQEQSPIPPLPLSGGHAFPPPPPPPAPASDSQENVNCATPRNSSTSYPETCLSSSSNQQSSFVDPAIISISSTDAQEKKLGLDKRAKSIKAKRTLILWHTRTPWILLQRRLLNPKNQSVATKTSSNNNNNNNNRLPGDLLEKIMMDRPNQSNHLPNRKMERSKHLKSNNSNNSNILNNNPINKKNKQRNNSHPSNNM